MARESSPECLPDGTVLRNYRLLRRLGRGGFGITYLAEECREEGDIDFSDKESNLFVIKENLPIDFAVRRHDTHEVVSRGDDAVFQWALTRFIEEADLLHTLSHPNIVPVLRAFRANGTAYFVMPWVEGSSLASYPAPQNVEEAKKLQELLQPLLEALSYIHGKNILHRDIKPDNILLTKEGKPVLIDFGAARSSIASHTMTRIGTPGYCPPEQMIVKGKPKEQADIYALGATFYHLITHQVPVESNERLVAANEGEPDPLPALSSQRKLKKLYPENFLSAIDRALNISIKDRWESATAWLNALTNPETETETVYSTQEPEPKPEPVSEPVSKPESKPEPQPVCRPTPAPVNVTPAPSGEKREEEITWSGLQDTIDDFNDLLIFRAFLGALLGFGIAIACREWADVEMSNTLFISIILTGSFLSCLIAARCKFEGWWMAISTAVCWWVFAGSIFGCLLGFAFLVEYGIKGLDWPDWLVWLLSILGLCLSFKLGYILGFFLGPTMGWLVGKLKVWLVVLIAAGLLFWLE